MKAPLEVVDYVLCVCVNERHNPCTLIIQLPFAHILQAVPVVLEARHGPKALRFTYCRLCGLASAQEDRVHLGVQ